MSRMKTKEQVVSTIQPLEIDEGKLRKHLADLLAIASPSGYTDTVVHHVADLLSTMGVDFELTRRGAIRVNLTGRQKSPDRAIVAHLDTLGAQVSGLKDNGRLAINRIGYWSARFAEGARCTIFTDGVGHRGTILPLKASGHVYGDAIDGQETGWGHVEIRVDLDVKTKADLEDAGFNVGDIVAIDTQPEFSEAGFINARHLDDKAGVAALLVALEAIVESRVVLPVDCHFLFTISEEVGSGASAVLHGDVAELVAVDNGTPAPGQNSSEFGVTFGMGDSTGPFDYHLTRLLLGLAQSHDIPHQRDLFKEYRCDAASAIEAGNDIRTALLTFGVDASHGYERTHISSIKSIAQLLTLYVQSPPAVLRDQKELAELGNFPNQPFLTRVIRRLRP